LVVTHWANLIVRTLQCDLALGIKFQNRTHFLA
jgi:hypothetical protein